MNKLMISLFQYVSVSLLLACNLNNNMIPRVLPDETILLNKSKSIKKEYYPEIKAYFSFRDNSNLAEISQHLSGLTPQLPMSQIESSDCNDTDDILIQDVFPFGAKKCLHYVVQRNDSFELIRSQNDLKKIFAPVESPEEALSFAIAANPTVRPMYKFTLPSTYTYKVEEIEKTNVRKEGANFKVNLFTNKCANTSLTEVIFNVSEMGSVSHIETKGIYFESSNQGNICE